MTINEVCERVKELAQQVNNKYEEQKPTYDKMLEEYTQVHDNAVDEIRKLVEDNDMKCNFSIIHGIFYAIIQYDAIFPKEVVKPLTEH